MKNKQLIKQEIERIIEEETPISKGSDYYHGAKESMEKLLQFINSLPEESSSKDLEEEINKVDNWYPIEIQYIRDIAYHFTEWQKEKDKQLVGATQKINYQHGYDEGKFDMREEMMKDAIEGWCINDGHILNDIRTLETEKANLKIGDEVKIIIVKTEQK